MSLPVISHNTPSVGSISWSSFGIQFNGLSYSIPADSTNLKFVWWVYNGGVPYLAESDTFPTLAAEDLMLFLNKGGIGLLVPNATVTDGGLVVPGSIYAQAIASDQIATHHLTANVVTAVKIAANAVTANALSANSVFSNHVTAGAITVDKLTSGSVGDNLVTNSSFEDDALGWTVVANTNGVISIATGVASSGAKSLEMSATTTAANLRLCQTPDKYIPVSSASGRKWYVGARMGTLAATTAGTYIRVNWFDGNKVLLSSGGTTDVISNRAMTTTFTVYDGQVTPPATARYMGIEIIFTNPNVATKLYVDEVNAQEVIVAAVIGDGQISTPKIAANAVVASTIAAGAVTARSLLIADLTNLWENPDFESDVVGLQPAGIENNATATVISGGANGSGKALQITALNGSNNDVYGQKIIPVVPGEKFFIRHTRKFLNAIGTSNAGIGFRTYNASKVAVTWTLVDFTNTRSTSWATTPGAIYTVPSGVFYIQPWISFQNNVETTNRFHVDDIVIRKMDQGQLLVDGSITAGKLETNLVLATKIIAGPPAGTHAEMASDGFHVYALDALTSLPKEVVKLGVANTDDYFAILNSAGKYVATIDQNGYISGQKLEAATEFTYKGRELSKLLDEKATGIVGWAQRVTGSTQNANNSQRFPYLRVKADVKAGRAYKVSTTPIQGNTSDGSTAVALRLVYALGADVVPFDNTLAIAETADVGTGSVYQAATQMSGMVVPQTDTTLSVMIAFGALGTGVCGILASTSNPVSIFIEDIGPTVPQTGEAMDGTAPPPAVFKNFYTEYSQTGGASYTGTNAAYNFSTDKMFQGESPAGQGNLRSIATYQSMATDLSGATISAMRVYLYFEQWYNNAGGTAYIGLHTHAAPPATFSHSVADAMVVGGWPKPGGRWVDIPSQYWPGFVAGTYKGISLLAPGGNYAYYGYAAENSKITVTYSKQV